MFVHGGIHKQTEQIWPSIVANYVDESLGIVDVSQIDIGLQDAFVASI